MRRSSPSHALKADPRFNHPDVVLQLRGWLKELGPALTLYLIVRGLGAIALVLAASLHGRSAHHILVSWDSQWYKGIAAHGYGLTRIHPDGRHLSDYAFFPLYPLCERIVSIVSGLPYLDAGLCVSWVCSIIAAAGIYRVSTLVYGKRVGLTTTLLWAAFPVAFVESMAYSESLFTALASWSLYAVLTQRWLSAGLLASFAGLTRPIGVALVVAVAITAAVAVVSTRMKRGDPRPRNYFTGPITAIVLAPLGLVGYLAYVAIRTHNVTGYFAVTAGWGNSIDGGLAFATWIGNFFGAGQVIAGLGLCAGVAVLIWACILLVRRRTPLPLIIFALGVVVLALTTSGYFGSKPRYLLPAFPLLMPAANWMARQRLPVWVGTAVAVCCWSIGYGALWWLGGGPP